MREGKGAAAAVAVHAVHQQNVPVQVKIQRTAKAVPHVDAAHLRILESMALTEVDAKYVPSSFEKLYDACLKALDVKAL